MGKESESSGFEWPDSPETTNVEPGWTSIENRGAVHKPERARLTLGTMKTELGHGTRPEARLSEEATSSALLGLARGERSQWQDMLLPGGIRLMVHESLTRSTFDEIRATRKFAPLGADVRSRNADEVAKLEHQIAIVRVYEFIRVLSEVARYRVARTLVLRAAGFKLKDQRRLRQAVQ